MFFVPFRNKMRAFLTLSHQQRVGTKVARLVTSYFPIEEGEFQCQITQTSINQTHPDPRLDEPDRHPEQAARWVHQAQRPAASARQALKATDCTERREAVEPELRLL